MGAPQSVLEKQVSQFRKEEVKGETPIFRSVDVPLHGELPDKFHGTISTLIQGFEYIRSKRGPESLYGSREKLPNGKFGKYIWKSYDEVYDIVTSFAKTLTERDLCMEVKEGGKKTRTLGIFCKTREEWVFSWIASWYITGCVVPLYDTLGEDSIIWIVEQAELKTVVTTVPYITSLIKLKKEGKIKLLENIITLEDVSAEEAKQIQEYGMKLYHFKECIENGRKSKVVLEPKVTPDTLATICYTSGTTARPKGVMLTHRNYITMSEGVNSLGFVEFVYGESCICWLPLAHVFEQFTVALCIVSGVRTGFYSGEVTDLVDDLKELKPEYFGSVPRVFGNIYEKTTKEISKLSGFKKWFYNRGVAAKLDYLKTTGSCSYSFYDRLVFNKIRSATGGKLLIVFLGGAPISPEVLQMSRIWLSCNIVQGYGQTETTGPILAQRADDVYPCSIGSTLSHAEGKLVDIPEMNYFSTDTTDGKPTPRGELLVRGGAVTPGYWRNPEMTKQTITEDGWIHTGDVAKISPWGHVTIIDRKKNLFKLAQGEYVAPEGLENIYQLSSYVKQIFVTGNSYMNFVVAIIVPRHDTMAEWAKKKGIKVDYDAIVKNSDFKLELLKDLARIAKEENKNGFEVVKNAYLTNEPFLVENNTMTPTQKIKRFNAEKKYKKEIDELYDKPPLNLKG
jgi:long-chain acyl-CoA synthetase